MPRWLQVCLFISSKTLIISINPIPPTRKRNLCIPFGGIAMSYRIHFADRFKKQSAEQLVTMAGALITGHTDNPAFPNPTVYLNGR
jgi:hypothetical protein